MQHPRIAEEARWLDYHKKRKGMQDQHASRRKKKDDLRDWEHHRRGVTYQQERRMQALKERQGEQDREDRLDKMENSRSYEDAKREWEQHRTGVAYGRTRRMRLLAEQQSARYKTAEYRFHDNPMKGSTYGLHDDASRILSRSRPSRLYMQPVREQVRGVTFTIMPDGRNKRVPTMNRQMVRAQNQHHADNEGRDIVQALQNIMQGKKPVDGKARFDRMGRARSQPGRGAHAREREPMRPDAGMGRGGLRPVPGLIR